jgi:iron complex outermembrane receptor protein
MKYNIEKNVEIYAKVNNIFEVKNGMWVRDNQIFPFDFERTYIVGINATF